MSAPSTGIKPGLAAIAAGLVLVLYFGASLLGRASDTPLAVDESTRQVLVRTFPQEWPFFTKSPLSKALHLFQRSPEGWVEQDMGTGLSPTNFFGFRRKSRVTGRELALVAEELLPFEWFDCSGDIDECLEGPPVAASLNAPLLEHPDLCGEFAIVMLEPKPWSWRDLDAAMPSKFAKFEIPCP